MNKLIGHEIPREKVKHILQSLDIKVTNVTETSIGLSIPTYRTDVRRPADVVEEILRIYGYNNIPSGVKLNSSIPDYKSREFNQDQNRITQQLTAQGFFELYNNSLTTPKHGNDQKEMVEILNPLSSEISVMRTNLLYGMLEAVEFNINRQQQDLRFFEFGNTYHKKDKKTVQTPTLGIVVTGQQLPNHWSIENKKSDFFFLKGVLNALFNRLGISTKEIPANNTFYTESIDLVHNEIHLGTFGLVNTRAFEKLSIEQDVYACTLSINALLSFRKNALKVNALSKFPAVHRDLALLLDSETAFEQLYQIAFKTEKQLLKDVKLFDVFTGKGIPDGKKSYALSFTLSDTNKTLTDKQIDKVMQKIANQFEKQLGATLR